MQLVFSNWGISWDDYCSALHAVRPVSDRPCESRADADIRLLTRRQPGKTAFEGKVVWITGASQVPNFLASLDQQPRLFISLDMHLWSLRHLKLLRVSKKRRYHSVAMSMLKLKRRRSIYVPSSAVPQIDSPSRQHLLYASAGQFLIANIE